MSANSTHVRRTPTVLYPDQSRVLLRPFNLGDAHRVRRIISRIMSLPETQVGTILDQISEDFSPRHQQIRRLFQERFEQLREEYVADEDLSEQRQQLIGSYFLAEYSLESAALFNPSIVLHPDQTGLAPGASRFILSLRATGEGHISSITFRTGIIYPDRIEVTPPAGFLTEPRQIPNREYEKGLFTRKLLELGLDSEFTYGVMNRLDDPFSLQQLSNSIDAEADKERRSEGFLQENRRIAQGIRTLALSNCEVQFRPEQELSERVIFPVTPSQRNGLEDARFVRFKNDDGTQIYYATFTAFDGRVVVPELADSNGFCGYMFWG